MSSLILVALALMWACLLVPMWLRRHEESAQDRSVDRFATAMRRLSRRVETVTTGRVVSAPRRGRDVAMFSTHDPYAHSERIEAARRSLAESARSRVLPRLEAGRRPVRLQAPADARSEAAARRAAGPSAARLAGRAALLRRRRRSMLALLGLAVLSLAGWAAGLVPWVLPVLLVLGLVGYLAHLRGEARRAAAVQRRRRDAARRRAAPPAAVRAEAPPAAPPVEESPAESTQPISAAAVEQAIAAAAGEAEGWQPTPVPLPTYVTAPVATRRPQQPVYDQEEFVSVVAHELDWDRPELEIDEVAEDDVERIVGRRAVGD